MRPTEVASILGLDRQLTVIASARPLLDGEFRDLNDGEPLGVDPEKLRLPASIGQTDDPPPQRRLRKVY